MAYYLSIDELYISRGNGNVTGVAVHGVHGELGIVGKRPVLGDVTIVPRVAMERLIKTEDVRFTTHKIIKTGNNAGKIQRINGYILNIGLSDSSGYSINTFDTVYKKSCRIIIHKDIRLVGSNQPLLYVISAQFNNQSGTDETVCMQVTREYLNTLEQLLNTKAVKADDYRQSVVGSINAGYIHDVKDLYCF